ncbi:ribonuclease S-7-like [Lycium barbarum]|uniref:ribonuclease S-7-like n=1 Tax=Lycium barbarum TaxID=112863 RepID=UPI00293ED201|nr:ribonuclease S-7-like [Lycium barbarum]
MEYLVTMIMLLSFIIPQQLVVSQTDYHHMQMVLQWPPIFCGKKGNYCNDPSLMQFTLHGLWPANSTGYTLSCFPPTTNTNMWLSDKALVRDLHTYWYSLIRGRADFALWKHEWEKHCYCASQTITDTEYFKGAVRFSKDPVIDNNAVLKKLRSKGITPSNSLVYKDTAIRNLFPNKNIYISCKKNATNHCSCMKYTFAWIQCWGISFPARQVHSREAVDLEKDHSISSFRFRPIPSMAQAGERILIKNNLHH